MFLFIAGLQPRIVKVDRIPRTCPSCGHGELYLKRQDQFFSLFFIPLFPVKKGIPFRECGWCRVIFDEDGLDISTRARPPGEGCPRCRDGLDRDFSFCPYCGRRL